ncbi:hypothetical protein [Secundilactobacillus mixtipabuli]|uniref:Uncharacterized protein n=1 Tax=Secundilactobacillus mixtipabuli TaxID=1435342 RepID=A0A1Z5I9Q3_9LACO|nr:hypothetical protein [Secundilactobacillus mixtipabuli]GAW98536.1 hypothetical protein IWT30_00481 [Secundilactobacillus mixtipabuli]
MMHGYVPIKGDKISTKNFTTLVSVGSPDSYVFLYDYNKLADDETAETVQVSQTVDHIRNFSHLWQNRGYTVYLEKKTADFFVDHR